MSEERSLERLVLAPEEGGLGVLKSSWVKVGTHPLDFSY